MFGFAAALALSSADPASLISEIVFQQEMYKRCLVEETVKIGADNSESAETILRAVSATCRPKEMELRALYAQTPFGAGHIESLMERDRKAGENAGVAALLKVRTKPKP